MTEQEAIDLLRFAFPKDITKPVTEEVISKAVKALEKQIPEKPLFGLLVRETAAFCSNCNSFVGFGDGSRDNYCPSCGQAIKWE